MANNLFRRTYLALASFKLSVFILFFMFVATWLGTLAQTEIGLFQSQQTYFESWYYLWPTIHVSDRLIGLPLPGGQLLMIALALNLLIGGIVRVKWRKNRAGILIAHFGVVLLLLAGWVKFAHSVEGSLALYEGEQRAEYVSYHYWEVVIEEVVGDGEVRQWVILEDDFRDRGGDRTVTFSEPGLPFSLTLTQYMPNARLARKGPMFEVSVPVVDGFFLDRRISDTESERNIAACYAMVNGPSNRESAGILWGNAQYPWTVTEGDRQFGVSLRKQRYPMSFVVKLDKFTHEYYPGTMRPRVFRSDVTVIDDGIKEPVEIVMNEPLRRDELILFQSGWGPPNSPPGARLYSVFSVVKNPSDKWPEWACYVILLGMLIHFGAMLKRYIRREMEARA